MDKTHNSEAYASFFYAIFHHNPQIRCRKGGRNPPLLSGIHLKNVGRRHASAGQYRHLNLKP